MPESLIDGVGEGYAVGVTSDNRLKTNSEVSETTPIDSTKNNPSWKFEYDTLNNLGSVTQFIETGSYVNVLTWEGFSGTSIGIGSRVLNIGSYS